MTSDSKFIQALVLTIRWVLALFIIGLIWQYFLYEHISHVFFASPHQTYTQLSTWWHDGTLRSMLGTTLSESATGFVIGVGGGLFLGLTIGLAPFLVGKLLEPVVVAVYAMPKLVLVPLLYISLGSGFTPTVFIVVMAVFPVVTIYTVSGIRTVDPDTVRMMQLFGSSKRQIGRKVMLPHTMGYFVTALLFVAPHAITIAIGAEILFATSNGIGGVLNLGATSFQAPTVLAALVVGTICSALAIGIVRLVSLRLLANGTIVAQGASGGLGASRQLN